MKSLMSTLMLMLVGMLLSASAYAQPNTSSGKCDKQGRVPSEFAQACALAHGTEVRCSGGTPMCCKQEGTTTRCYDDVNDVPPRSAGTGMPSTPGDGRLAPPLTTPNRPMTPMVPGQDGTLKQ